MGEVITLAIIAIGVVLLLVFQGMVLASLNEEPEESERKSPATEKKSFIDAIKKLLRKSHEDNMHIYKVS
jgi:hypothetical protein